MKNRRRLLKIMIPISIVIFSAFFIPWGMLTLWISPLPDSVQKEVESAINHGLDGIIVYVDEPEGTSLYSAGWNNRDDKVEADPEALFKIASISKLYIAVAAAEDVGIFLTSLNDGTLVKKNDFKATQYIGCTGHNNLPMLKAFQNNGCTVIERNKVFKTENKNLFRVKGELMRKD